MKALKPETLLAYLRRGTAMLHLDARREGVQVPARHAQDPHLRLDLDLRYRGIALELDREGVWSTLSFQGSDSRCRVPWQAIFGMTLSATGEGEVWLEDLPVEVLGAMKAHRSPDLSGRPSLQPLRRLGARPRTRAALFSVSAVAALAFAARGQWAWAAPFAGAALLAGSAWRGAASRDAEATALYERFLATDGEDTKTGRVESPPPSSAPG
jgi:hypothetical protein